MPDPEIQTRPDRVQPLLAHALDSQGIQPLRRPLSHDPSATFQPIIQTIILFWTGSDGGGQYRTQSIDSMAFMMMVWTPPDGAEQPNGGPPFRATDAPADPGQCAARPPQRRKFMRMLRQRRRSITHAP
jgi:hypothetical protein